MTAHLAMARYLSGSNSYDITRRLAEVGLLALITNEAEACEKLKSVKSQDPATPELELVAWQDGQYREFKPSPPRHRFGLSFVDYCQEKPGRE